MKIAVIAVGKMKPTYYREAMDDYLGRLTHYASVSEIEVRQDAALARAIPKGMTTVALEVNGKAFDSRGLARSLEEWGSNCKSGIAFLIGGAEGIPADLSQRADFRLSVSSLTLPHRMARVLLAEQLYRSMTILRGEPYARED